MRVCERCEEPVERVLRHRAYGASMTHRVTRWLCTDCHPTPPRRGRSGRADAGRAADSVVTDGGTATACPRCAASTVNVHGIYDCVECHWHSY
jgi:transposase-like protein